MAPLRGGPGAAARPARLVLALQTLALLLLAVAHFGSAATTASVALDLSQATGDHTTSYTERGTPVPLVNTLQVTLTFAGSYPPEHTGFVVGQVQGLDDPAAARIDAYSAGPTGELVFFGTSPFSATSSKWVIGGARVGQKFFRVVPSTAEVVRSCAQPADCARGALHFSTFFAGATANTLFVIEAPPAVSALAFLQVRFAAGFDGLDEVVQAATVAAAVARPAPDTLRFTLPPGDDTVADYQRLLSDLVYLNTATEPSSAADRILAVAVSEDGTTLGPESRCTIAIVLANSFDPALAGPAAFAVEENTAAGALVARLAASDLDLGPDGNIASFALETASTLFRLDAASGNLTATGSPPIDREDPSVGATVSLTVLIADGGTPPRTGRAAITIAVLDRNDNRPVFVNASTVLAVPETHPPGLPFARVVATDADSTPANARITYRIAAGDPAGRFSISPASGDVELVAPLDTDAPAAPLRTTLTLAATDSGSPQRSATPIKLVIDATPVNEHPPVFVGAPFTATVRENQAGGALIALGAALAPTDRDSGFDGQVTVALAASAAPFALDTAAGGLRTTAVLDFEATPFFDLTLVATDAGLTPGPLQAEAALRVFVSDANDAPVVAPLVQAVVVEENTLPATPLATFAATDPDAGSAGVVVWTLLPPGAPFAVDQMGRVTVARPLDREATPLHELTLVATDGGGLTGTAALNVSVADANDSPPTLAAANRALVAAEDAPVGPPIATLVALDADLGANAVVRFAFATGAADPTGQFSLDAASGALSLLRGLDREAQALHALTVRLTDGGQPANSADVAVSLAVGDVNDNAPELLPGAPTAATVAEDSVAGTPVLSLAGFALDRDAGANGQIEFSVQGGAPPGLFGFPTAGPDLQLLLPALDRESVPAYNLTIRLEDGGTPPLSASARVSVSVGDANDNAPVFRGLDSGSVLEDAPLGATATTVLATDDDAPGSAFARVRYAVASDPSGLWDVDPVSGRVFLAQPGLDRETQASHEVLIRASDGGVPALSAQGLVTIQVLDVNDNAPLFSVAKFLPAVPESTAVGTVLGTFRAADADLGMAQNVTYSLAAGSDPWLQIDAISGRLAVALPLNREARDEARFRVVAADQGAPPLATTSPEFGIRLLDVNDNPPVLAPAVFSAAESAAPGTPLGRLQAQDPDLAETMLLVFRADPGCTAPFAVAANGSVTVRAPLDFEARRTHTCVVTVSDGLFESAANLTLAVKDVNDNTPTVLVTALLPAFPEDLPVGTALLTIQADDADDGANGDVALTIRGSPQAPFPFPFRLSADGRQVELAAPLDADTVAAHNITFVATDAGQPALTTVAHFVLAVSDVNDQPPVLSTGAPKVFVEGGPEVPLLVDSKVSDPDATHQTLASASVQVVGALPGDLLRLPGGTILPPGVSLDPLASTPALLVLRGVAPIPSYVAVLRAVVFSSILDEPSDAPRTANVTVSDGRFTVSSAALGVAVLLVQDQAPVVRLAGPAGLNFTTQLAEGGPAVQLSSGPVVLDLDSGAFLLSGLTVRVESPEWDPTTETISATPAAPVSTSTSADGQLLTLTGPAAAPAFAAALATVRYRSTADEHVGASRLFRVVASHPTLDSTPAFAEVQLLPINDPPALALAVPGPDHAFEFAEGLGPVPLFANVTIADPDDADVANATVALRAAASPQAALALDPARLAAGMVVLEAGPRRVVVAGRASAPAYEALLQGITYDNPFQAAPEARDGVDAAVADPQGARGTATVAVSFQGVNDPPELDLNGPQQPGQGFATVFTEGGAPVAVADPALTLADVDDTIMSGLSIDLAPVLAAEQEMLLFNTSGTSLSVSRRDNYRYKVFPSGTLAEVAAVIRSIRYANLEGEPSPVQRTVTLTLTDKALTVTRQAVIDIQLVNDPPRLDAAPSSAPVAFVEEGAPVPLLAGLAGGQVGVSDPDSDRILTLRLGMAGVRDPMAEMLLTPFGNITLAAGPNVTTTVAVNLTLAEAALALDAMLYVNLDAEPTAGERVLDFAVSDGLADSNPVRVAVAVANVNDNQPAFPEANVTVEVAEGNAAPAQLAGLQAEDGDAGPQGVLRYSIVGTDFAGAFSLDAATGDLRVERALDREGGDTVFRLVVEASDGELAARLNVTVVVLDVNDNPPVLPGLPLLLRTDENLAGAVPLHATDADAGANAEVRLEAVFQASGDASLFRLVPLNASAGLELQWTGLDREAADAHNITVRACDAGLPPLCAESWVAIGVDDVNDSPAVIDPAGPLALDVAEHTAFPLLLVTFAASDADGPPHDSVSFHLTQTPPGAPFAVDAGSGRLTLAGDLDREALGDTVVLVVEARNAGFLGAASSESNATVEIAVGDINDNAPVVTAPASVSLLEDDAATGRLVAVVATADADAGPNGNVTCEVRRPSNNAAPLPFGLTDSGAGLFALRNTAPLDREAQSRFEVAVACTDGGAPPLGAADAVIEVLVEDANDTPPRFLQANFSATLAEGAPGGTNVVRLLAEDDDGVGILRFSLSAAAALLFAVDEFLGTITLQGALLDFETATEHAFAAFVTDGVAPPAEAQVVVRVLNENDNAPELVRVDPFVAVLDENTLYDTAAVLQVLDRDSPPFATLAFSLAPGTDPAFSIGPATGVVAVAATLDFETATEHRVQCLVTDGLHVLSVNLTFAVGDLNDNSPVFVGGPNQRLVVSEAAPPGSILGPIGARDEDSGPRGLVTYELAADSDALAAFDLNATTASLTVGPSGLDFEVRQSYTLVVVARDGGSPQRSANATVVVDVLDANDNPPVFGHGDVRLRFETPQPAGEVVAQLRAADADSGAFGRIGFRVSQSEGLVALAVDNATGAISLGPTGLGGVGDFGTATVEACDGGEPALCSAVRVFVVLSETVAPRLEADAGLFAHTSNASAFGVPGEVQAVLSLLAAPDSSVTVRASAGGFNAEAPFAVARLPAARFTAELLEVAIFADAFAGTTAHLRAAVQAFDRYHRPQVAPDTVARLEVRRLDANGSALPGVVLAAACTVDPQTGVCLLAAALPAAWVTLGAAPQLLAASVTVGGVAAPAHLNATLVSPAIAVPDTAGPVVLALPIGPQLDGAVFPVDISVASPTAVGSLALLLSFPPGEFTVDSVQEGPDLTVSLAEAGGRLAITAISSELAPEPVSPAGGLVARVMLRVVAGAAAPLTEAPVALQVLHLSDARGNIVAQNQTADALDRSGLQRRSAGRVFVGDAVAVVLPVARSAALLNTAMVDAVRVASPVSLVAVSLRGVLSTPQPTACASRASAVVQVATAACDEVFLDGSEFEGSPAAAVVFSVGAIDGTLLLAVYAPQLPVALHLQNTTLRPIAGWLDPGSGCAAQRFESVGIEASAVFSPGSAAAEQALAVRLRVTALVQPLLRSSNPAVLAVRTSPFGSRALGLSPGAAILEIAAGHRAVGELVLTVTEADPVQVAAVEVVVFSGLDLDLAATGAGARPVSATAGFAPPMLEDFNGSTAQTLAFVALSDGVVMFLADRALVSARVLDPAVAVLSADATVVQAVGLGETTLQTDLAPNTGCNSSVALATALGPIVVTLPRVMRVTASVSATQLAHPASEAALLGVATEATLTVRIFFSDGREKDMTNDPQTLYSVTGSAIAVARAAPGPARLTATTPSLAGTVRLSVAFRDINASAVVELEAVVVQTFELRASPFPVSGGGASNNVSIATLSLIAPTSLFQQALLHVAATLSDGRVLDLSADPRVAFQAPAGTSVSGRVLSASQAGAPLVSAMFGARTAALALAVVSDTPVTVARLVDGRLLSGASAVHGVRGAAGADVLDLAAELSDGRQLPSLFSAAGPLFPGLVTLASLRPTVVAVDPAFAALTVLANFEQPIRLLATAASPSVASLAVDVAANLAPAPGDLDLGQAQGPQFPPVAVGEQLLVPVRFAAGNETLTALDAVLDFDDSRLVFEGAEQALGNVAVALLPGGGRLSLTGSALGGVATNGVVALAALRFSATRFGLAAFSGTIRTALFAPSPTAVNVTNATTAIVSGQGRASVDFASRRRRRGGASEVLGRGRRMAALCPDNTTAPCASCPGGRPTGDVDLDCRFDVADAVRLLKLLAQEALLAGSGAPTLLGGNGTDANRDGAVDPDDALFLNEVAGGRLLFPPTVAVAPVDNAATSCELTASLAFGDALAPGLELVDVLLLLTHPDPAFGPQLSGTNFSGGVLLATSTPQAGLVRLGAGAGSPTLFSTSAVTELALPGIGLSVVVVTAAGNQTRAHHFARRDPDPAAPGSAFTYSATITPAPTAAFNSSVAVARAAATFPFVVFDNTLPSPLCFNDFDPDFGVAAVAVDVPENQTVGVAFLTVEATDGDLGPNGAVSYAVTGGNADALFAVSAQTGELSLAARGDFEQDARRDLVITASDGGSPVVRSSQLTVRVRFLDINDNVPVFVGAPCIASVEEGNATGRLVFNLTAADGDGTPTNARVTFVPGAGFPDFLAVDPASGELRTDAAIDFEVLNRSRFQFAVVARDSGAPTLQSAVACVLDVLDANDNLPQFDRGVYTATVPEDLAVGSLVVNATAVDRDSGANSAIVYALRNAPPAFEVGAATGEIRLRFALDFEATQAYEFQVVAANPSNGSGPAAALAAERSVFVSVTDVNDNGPVVEPAVSAIQVLENAPPGVLLTLNASDRDAGSNARLRFTLVADANSTAAALFAVDPAAGTVASLSALDREAAAMHRLAINVSDSGEPPLSVLAEVLVNVTDANDNRPVAVSPPPAAVLEDAALGTEVARVNASDADAGENGALAFRVAAGDGAGAFAIDGQGRVTVAAALDREGEAAYTLTVVVSDGGSPALNATATVDVTILDVNDNVPVFGAVLFEAAVPEDLAVGAPLLDLVATDLDAGSNAALVWSIDTGTPFEVNATTGALSLATQLNRESQANYTFEARVADSGAPPLSTAATVTVRVLDVNDERPTLLVNASRVIVRENNPVGLVVPVGIEASDADEPGSPNARLSVTVTGGPGVAGSFAVNQSTLRLEATAVLDRETRDGYLLTLTAIDGGSPALRSDPVNITVVVADANDNRPVFNESSYACSLLENATLGAACTIVAATDADATTGVSYALLGGNASDFVVNAAGVVTLAAPLDREATAEYRLEVLATDAGSPPLNQTVPLTVRVLDVNDNPPVVLGQPLACVLPENSAVGTVCVAVAASDRDEPGSPNSRVAFSLLGGPATAPFTIDATTGEVRTTGLLDFENTTAYTLRIAARDEGSPSLGAEATIAVSVTDANDNAPAFNRANYSCRVVEGVAAGTQLNCSAPILAVDLDERGNNNSLIAIETTAPSAEFEVVQQQSGNGSASAILVLRRELDRERQASHALTLLARDHGVPSLTALANVVVLVGDVNDNAPAFAGAPYACRITENVMPPLCDAAVSARDPDAPGTNESTVRYSLADDAAGLFVIDPVTGAVRGTAALDRENRSSYSLTVVAADLASPPLSNTSDLHIEVDDVNDNAPDAPPTLRCGVAEDAPAGTVCTAVAASDRDEGPNALLSFQIVQGNVFGAFVVDALGRVLTAAPLDREVRAGYSLTVLVSDAGTPPRTATTVVEVEVGDINDCTPTFSAPEFVCAFAENSTGPQPACMAVMASDCDAPGPNSNLTFRLLDDASGLFEIDAVSGAVSPTATLDREALSSHTLRVAVSDQGAPPLSSEANLTVTVLDVNDNAPAFLVARLDCAVLENAPAGTPCGSALAEDADEAGTLQSLVQYALLGANAGAASFAVLSDGTVVTAVPLDREAVAAYNLTVRAQDSATGTAAGPALSALLEVHVTVLDENDNAPDVLNAGVACSFDEAFGPVGGNASAPDFQPCLQLVAADADATGPNSRFGFALVDGGADPRFQLTAGGSLTVDVALLDREVAPSIQVPVAVTDEGSPALTTVVNVTVELRDRNDNAPQFPAAEFSVRLAERTPAGAVVAALAAVDADAGPNGLVSHSIVGGPLETANATFPWRLDNSSGALRLAGSLDHTVTDSYRFEIQAVDNGQPPLNATATVVVTVEPFLRALNSTAIQIDWDLSFPRPAGYHFAEINQRQPAACGPGGIVLSGCVVTPSRAFLVPPSSNLTSIIIPGLLPATQYEYELVFSLLSGQSISHGFFRIATQDAAPEGVLPPGFQELSATSVRVSWPPPQTPNGVIARYELFLQAFGPTVSRRRAVTEQDGLVRVFEGAERETVADELVPGSRYGFVVRAHTSAGFSDSDMVFFTPGAAGAGGNNAGSSSRDYIGSLSVDAFTAIIVLLIFLLLILLLVWLARRRDRRDKMETERVIRTEISNPAFELTRERKDRETEIQYLSIGSQNPFGDDGNPNTNVSPIASRGHQFHLDPLAADLDHLGRGSNGRPPQQVRTVRGMSSFLNGQTSTDFSTAGLEMTALNTTAAGHRASVEDSELIETMMSDDGPAQGRYDYVVTSRDAVQPEFPFTTPTTYLGRQYPKAVVDPFDFKTICAYPVDGVHTAASSEANAEKNRDAAALPFDHNRVKLVDRVRGDYINASYVDGYYESRLYMVTQAPLDDTRSSFWKLVWQQDATAVVALATEPEECDQYWPLPTGTAQYNQLSVHAVQEIGSDHYELRRLRVEHLNTGKERAVGQYHGVLWSAHDTPLDCDAFLVFLAEIRRGHRDAHEPGPLVVQGRSGGGRAGVFCALDICLDSLLATGYVDLPRTLLKLREQRPALAGTREQYAFCCQALARLCSIYTGAVRSDDVVAAHIRRLLGIAALDDVAPAVVAAQPPRPPPPPPRQAPPQEEPVAVVAVEPVVDVAPEPEAVARAAASLRFPLLPGYDTPPHDDTSSVQSMPSVGGAAAGHTSMDQLVAIAAEPTTASPEQPQVSGLYPATAAVAPAPPVAAPVVAVPTATLQWAQETYDLDQGAGQHTSTPAPAPAEGGKKRRRRRDPSLRRGQEGYISPGESLESLDTLPQYERRPTRDIVLQIAKDLEHNAQSGQTGHVFTNLTGGKLSRRVLAAETKVMVTEPSGYPGPKPSKGGPTTTTRSTAAAAPRPHRVPARPAQPPQAGPSPGRPQRPVAAMPRPSRPYNSTGQAPPARPAPPVSRPSLDSLVRDAPAAPARGYGGSLPGAVHPGAPQEDEDFEDTRF